MSMYRRDVTVFGSDYHYFGRIVSIFEKRSGAIRCVIEDENGRLFIHNAKQLKLSEEQLRAFYQDYIRSFE